MPSTIAQVQTNYKYQLNFYLVLDIPPEKRRVCQNWAAVLKC